MPTENRSSNTEQMVSVPFSREERYIVIKHSDVAGFWREDVREQFFAALERLNEHSVRIPQRQYLVIESDWPEYEPAWSMIEARVTGRATSDGFSAGDMADQGAKAFAARDPEVETLHAQLVQQGSLLQRCVMAVREQHCDEGEAEFDLPVDLMSDINAALLEIANKEWRMNPCKQGHRDVGAAGGIAHCYTCGEEIVAATTQEAFEQWNASHPASSTLNPFE